MKLLCAAAVLLCASMTFAQLKLIPTPQKVQIMEGRFSLANDPQRFLHIERVATPIHSPGGDESYQMLVRPNSITIRASGDPGIAYATQTLEQLIRANDDANASIPCCEITDWPALKYRVWQDDISRGPIPTMDFLKREVRTLSEWKYNAMTLYTEHVFKLKKHPDIAPDDGITAEQIKELSEYAKQYHVELIGNFQSFGHMAHILSLPAYKDLGDNAWNISPAKEESYKFLADCYSEVAPAYESKLFDINCDEVSLGKEGASKEMVAKLGLAEVYARHINRCCELLRPYGKTAMMWGDIATQHQDIVPKLPKDLIVLSWGYGAKDSFDNAIEPFTKIGLRFMVCPGVSCWNRIFPDFHTAQINIANYVRDGVKHGGGKGAIGMINTSWDDDGENFFNQTWYPFAWGAEVAWNPVDNDSRESRQKAFDTAFAANFYGASDDAVVRELWKISDLRSNPSSGDLSDRSFWRLRAKDASGNEKLAADADAIAEALRAQKTRVKSNADTLDYAIFACRRISFMARHASMPLEKQLAELKSLREEYARLWKLENRDWWLDWNLDKYDQYATRLQAAATQPTTAPE